jgi:hypothetical protein
VDQAFIICLELARYIEMTGLTRSAYESRGNNQTAVEGSAANNIEPGDFSIQDDEEFVSRRIQAVVFSFVLCILYLEARIDQFCSKIYKNAVRSVASAITFPFQLEAPRNMLEMARGQLVISPLFLHLLAVSPHAKTHL